MTHFDSNILAKRVIDALRMTYQGAIEQARDVRPSLPVDAASRLATVNLTGSPSYRVTVTANPQGGIALAQAMFECPEHEVTRIMIDDAMCELANMTAGQVKGLIAQAHRVSQLGVVRGDQLERDAKLLVGTCLRLPVANAEISILLAERPVASVSVVGASTGMAGEEDASANAPKTRPDVSPGKSTTVDAVSFESNALLDGGIAVEQDRSIEQVRASEQGISVVPPSPIEQGVLVELSAPTVDTRFEKISSHVDEPVSSDPSAMIATANSQDIAAATGPSGTAPLAVEASFNDASIAPDVSSAMGNDPSDYLPHDPRAVNEPLATESTGLLVQESASVTEATQSIRSPAHDMSVDASICVDDDAAAADMIAQEQYLSMLTTPASDQLMTLRPTRPRGLPVGEDDRVRVMIAQRNEAPLKVIRRAVLSRNMRLVAIARDGEEAVSEALRAKPDLLCLDLNLDKQDGLQALARIRSELPTLTVVIVSASATTPQVRRAMELQVVSVIVSPLTHSRLTGELARIAPFTSPEDGRLRTRADVSSPLTSDQIPYLQ